MFAPTFPLLPPMRLRRFFIVRAGMLAATACLALVLAGPRGVGQDSASDSVDKDYAGELPRISPTEPEAALATFATRPGFHMELVAAEPLVNSPVAAAYDEDGRLYVVEMRGYSENQDDKISQVRLLEDTDSDGRYDRASVFLEGLRWPTAIACASGGVFVGDAPEIFYARDADGDGRAELRTTVYSGFGTSNVQGLLNSFQWGPDNRIYGSASSTGGTIETVCTPADLWGERAPAAPATAGQTVSLSGRDFSFDPRSLELRAESGGAQHGMTFDDWGTRYVCSNSDHIQQIMYDEADAARNRLLLAAGARKSIAADGPQAEVFRTSQVEPWRVVRTRLRVAGIVPGPVEGGGRAAGYFTSATGVTIYRGDAYPREYRGNAFVGDVGSNIIHRKTIDMAAIQHIARRADEGVEFVTSTDVWFRPCQFVNAPDGSLHVLDVYREVIEHPASLPPVIKKHLDLTAGRDRGRIYRIAPERFVPRKPLRLSLADADELVTMLEHGNGWHVDTAARLIYERQDPAAVPHLKKLAVESKAPPARMRALHALAGLDALDEATLLAGLADEEPGVRRHAVRLAARQADPSAALIEKLAAMAGDADVHVRYQLAFALGNLPVEARLAPLLALVKTDAADPWARLAIQSSLAEGGDRMVVALLAEVDVRNAPAVRTIIAALSEQEARRRAPNAAASIFGALAGLPAEDAGALACLTAYVDALRRDDQTLDDVLADEQACDLAKQRVANVIDAAARVALDESAEIERRVAATQSLGLAEQTHSALADLLAARQPPPVQLAALGVLARRDDPQNAAALLAAWSGFGPGVRREATEVLFGRPAWIVALLEALEARHLAVGDFDPARLQQLLEHQDEQLRERAVAVLGNVKLQRRADVVEAYRGALALAGDATRGKTVFAKVCSACHKVEGVGHELGPNLATLKNRGAEALLLNVLDPNREVNPQFVNYTAVTIEGRSLTGMLTAEAATSVTLTRAEGAADTLLRADIEDLRSSGLSLMPEGLEQQIDQQAMADLIAYLLTLK